MCATFNINQGTELSQAEKQFEAARKHLLELRRSQPQLKIEEYTLHATDGSPVSFKGLFDDRNELLVIHNMGKSCSYCTLWADGLIGFTEHLNNRVPFVLVTPDKPEVAKAFSESRGWKFRVLSADGTSFIKDMGFTSQDGSAGPGVSAFKRTPDGQIFCTARDEFGPGDLYCSIWHLIDLLPNQVNGWEPKYTYSK